NRYSLLCLLVCSHEYGDANSIYLPSYPTRRSSDLSAAKPPTGRVTVVPACTAPSCTCEYTIDLPRGLQCRWLVCGNRFPDNGQAPSAGQDLLYTGGQRCPDRLP